MNNTFIKIKDNEDLNEVDIRTLQEIFKKDIVSVRELIDELLDKHDQLSRQDEDSEELRRMAYEDEQLEEREVQMHFGN